MATSIYEELSKIGAALVAAGDGEPVELTDEQREALAHATVPDTLDAILAHVPFTPREDAMPRIAEVWSDELRAAFRLQSIADKITEDDSYQAIQNVVSQDERLSGTERRALRRSLRVFLRSTNSGTTSSQLPVGPRPRAYLASISVEGFRGIGQRADLPLEPRPGLTLIYGANGSGKSTFAEALDVLLTGSTARFAGRGHEWRSAWANAHSPDQGQIDVEFLVEDQDAQRDTLTRNWTAADLSAATGEKDNPLWEPVKTIGGLDVAGAIDEFRPILGYGELGPLFDESGSLDDPDSGYVTPFAQHIQARASIRDGTTDALWQLIRHRDHRDALYTELSAWQSCVREVRMAAAVAKSARSARQAATEARQAATEARQAATEAKQAATEAQLAGAAGSTRAARAAEAEAEARAERAAGAAEAKAEARAAEAEARAAEAEAKAEARKKGEESLLQLVLINEATLRSPSDWHWEALAARHTVSVSDENTQTDLLRVARAYLPRFRARLRGSIAQSATQKHDGVFSTPNPSGEFLGYAPRVRSYAEMLLDEIHSARLEQFSQRVSDFWQKIRRSSDVRFEALSLQQHRPIDEEGIPAPELRVSLGLTIDGDRAIERGALSQGELHSLALSVFLPTLMRPESPFGFAVIDDPVQAMDEYAVDGLAEVLRDAAEELQVIVFTHDKRLPRALRLLDVEHTLINITRSPGSNVKCHVTRDPVLQALDDAQLTAEELLEDEDEDLWEAVGLHCRLAIEEAAIRTARRKMLRNDVSPSVVRDRLDDTVYSERLQARKLVALAIWGDAQRIGEVRDYVTERFEDVPINNTIDNLNGLVHGDEARVRQISDWYTGDPQHLVDDTKLVIAWLEQMEQSND